MGVDKLPFLIAAVSSHEEDFPPEELLMHNHTPLAKGWRSERFCIFPQVLILKLAPGNCRLRKIQILSHHFMVATQLEFFIGRSVRPLGTIEKGVVSEMQTYDPMNLPASQWIGGDGGGGQRPDSAASTNAESGPAVTLEDVESRGGDGIRRVEFTRLGDNAKSNFLARELKSIHIDAEGDYVKIQAHKNYINTLNLYNQWLLVVLDPLLPDPEWQPPHNNQNAGLWGSVNQPPEEKAALSVKDLAFSIYHDDDIAKLIEMVLASKEAAVKDENYPLAKALKALYQLSKKAGEEIARLQVTKAQAVQREDYEMAEDVKSDIQYIKTALKQKMIDLGLEENEKHQIVPKQPPRTLEHPIALDASMNEKTKDRPQSVPRTPSPRPLPVPPPPKVPSPKQPVPVVTPPAPPKREEPVVVPPPPPPKVLTQPPPPPVVESSKNSFGLDNPEALTEDQSDEFEKPIRVFGSFVMRCLLSRQFKLREWALEEVSKRLEGWEIIRKKKLGSRGRKTSHQPRHEPKKGSKTRGRALKASYSEPKPRKGVSWGRSVSRDQESRRSSDGDESEGSQSERESVKTSFTEEVKVAPTDVETFVPAAFEVVRKGLDDSREKVTMLSLSLWDQLTRICVSQNIPSSIVFRYLEPMFFSLLMKSSDLNPRIKSGCADLLLAIENAYHSAPHTALPYLTKPIPKKGLLELWRYVKARLDALQAAVKSFGVDTDGSHILGLSLESVIHFAEPQLHHKNAEVRESAVKVVVELVMRVDEESVSPYLKNVKPQLLQIIKDKITEARAAPWKENPLADEETNEEVVDRLTEEINALKNIVEGTNNSGRKGGRHTDTLSPKPDNAKLASGHSTKARQTPAPSYRPDPDPKPDSVVHPEETEDPALNWSMDK
ncbi:hypothetical protein HDU67_005837 [Dinochytrium kinnereticum]|nr:hypothetical protein HDU67_005837 [Dinochytrium kinnereticum]